MRWFLIHLSTLLLLTSSCYNHIMKRFIVFLIMCLASVNFCIASDFASVVLPSSYIRKNDGVMLYSKNLEEVFGEKLVNVFALEKNFNAPRLITLKNILTTNPQLNSMISREEKVVIVSKICGANKVISINVKYELCGLNRNITTPFAENSIIRDSNSIRISTRVEVYDTITDRCAWTNTYYKSFNFDNINSKDISLIENYYTRLADVVLLEIKSNSNVRSIEHKKTVKPEKPKQEKIKKDKPKKQPVSKPVVKPVSQVKETPKIKPQLELKENAGEGVNNFNKVNKVKSAPKTEKKPASKPVPAVKKEKPAVKPVKQKVEQKPIKKEKIEKKPVKEKTKLKLWDSLKNNIQVDVKPSTPQKEYKPEEVESIPMNIQPAHTNMHIKRRMNSRNFSPKYNYSVNDI